MVERLERTGAKDFSPLEFIEAIAAVSRTDGKTPDAEKGIGRECYAFSEQEDRAFQVAEATARTILAALKEGEDYRIEKDAIGNVFVNLITRGANMPPVMVGSHLDSVLQGGKYDGPAGVAAGLAVLSEVARDKSGMRRGLTLAIFRSEESSPRNGVACLGSSVATGLIEPQALNAIVYDKAQNLTLQEHFTRRYGEARWNAVLQESRTAVIRPERFSAYFETHIEQSSVIAAQQKDVGIVTEGIGGARRERVRTPLKAQRLPTLDGLYRRIVLVFEGEPNHTGGTPPNPVFYKSPGVVWYRKDALVAACNATNKILGNSRFDVKVLGSQPDEARGFTSIPSHQAVELLVPSGDMPALTEYLGTLQRETAQRLDVNMQFSDTPHTAPSADIVAPDDVRKLLNLPQVISALSTKAFARQESETGTTRATVTDYYLAPDSISYNLDVREVNEQDLEELIKAIHGRTDLTLGDGKYVTISAKVHSPIDPALSGRLSKFAEGLGISFVLMPSMPGHDADRISAAGIPTAMVFIRQEDGVSHNPYEKMRDADFTKAVRLLKDAVLHSLRNG